MSKIILASGSPRRKELLEQIGIEFDIITSDVDETTLITQPDEYVKYLSRIKAQAVWDMVKDDDDYRNEDVVVIGADIFLQSLRIREMLLIYLRNWLVIVIRCIQVLHLSRIIML